MSDRLAQTLKVENLYCATQLVRMAHPPDIYNVEVYLRRARVGREHSFLSSLIMLVFLSCSLLFSKLLSEEAGTADAAYLANYFFHLDNFHHFGQVPFPLANHMANDLGLS